MAQIEKKLDNMLFNYETTYRTDFQPTKLTAPVFTTYKPKSVCLKTRPPPLKDIHTLCDWKTVGIPFNLLHKPRDHTGTNPNEIQKPYFEPIDQGKEEAIKTRPRRIMTPQVSMDDIEDSNVRALLIEDIYTSEMTKGLREAVRPYFKVSAPLPGLPAKANPITLPKLVEPYVSPEWRMDSVSWDNRQLRSYCDSTKRFWLSQELPPCRACKDSNIMNVRTREACLQSPGRSPEKNRTF